MIKKQFVLIILVLLLLTGCQPQTTSLPENSLTVHFIDVGQGDAILLVDSDETMLIDSGDQRSGKTVSDYLSALGITDLDYVVATHNHTDHSGGLLTIMNKFNVDNYWITQSEETKASQKALQAAQNQGATINNPGPGDSLSLGQSSIKVLGPLKNYSEANDDSIVLKISHGQNTFLLTGDMEAPAERDLVEAGVDLDADVLKVGHHGGSSSSTYIFLRAVNPAYSVISCGLDNDYGHPHKETMSRLNDVGSIIFQTAQEGTIIATSLDNQISFNVAGQVPSQPHQDSEGFETAFIGNLNSQVYHLPTCSSLPKESNRIYFASEKEAKAQGYRPCGRCQP